MPAVARLLLLLQLLQAFSFAVPKAVVPVLPVVFAVLVDQPHLGLAEDGQQVLVLPNARGPGAGLNLGEGWVARIHQDVVDRAAGEDH